MAFGTLNALKKGDITPRQVRRGAGLIGHLKLNSTLRKGDGIAMPKKKHESAPDPIDALRKGRDPVYTGEGKTLNIPKPTEIVAKQNDDGTYSLTVKRNVYDNSVLFGVHEMKLPKCYFCMLVCGGPENLVIGEIDA